MGCACGMERQMNTMEKAENTKRLSTCANFDFDPENINDEEMEALTIHLLKMKQLNINY